ncbi:hypothetical protein L7F22_038924 [Adiantum nelumboides]|nr:hypothetical protein [Adiantum nelumboides]
MVPRQDQHAQDERQRVISSPSRTGFKRMLATSRSTAAVFIVANSLTAGSIFCFPLFGPKMSADLGLNLTQTNAIWSAAILGQYASAAIFGHIADTYGPRPLSLMASILFGVGYVLMAHTESDAISHQQSSSPSSHSNRANFVAMAAYFVLVGTGVAASIFSALRSSTSHFKSHPGLALSIPLTLFSLSSLFLSAFASLSFFTDPNTGDLNSPKWLAWLGAALMITNALSAFGLSVPEEGQGREEAVFESAQEEEDEPATERTTLLGSRPLPALLWSIPYGRNPSDYPREPLLSLKEYLSAPSVWIMGLVLFAGVGGAEMVMGSIGSIVVSLRAVHTALDGDNQDDKTRLGRETLALRTQQVQLLAIANTVSRLFVGLLTDLCSPQASIKRASSTRTNQTTWKNHLQKFTISRLSLLLVGLALLFFTFIYSSIFVDRVDRLWLVSLATGTGYGLTFTVLPSTIICVWPQQFGRNYGLLTYAAALGSLFFSMLFANINDRIASRQFPIKMPDEKLNLLAEAQQAICPYGRECFAPSFALAALIVGIAFFATIPLWRAWRTLL